MPNAKRTCVVRSNHFYDFCIVGVTHKEVSWHFTARPSSCAILRYILKSQNLFLSEVTCRQKTQEIWLPTTCWHRFKNALCLARLCLGQKQYRTLYVFGVISHTRVKIQVQANLQNLCVLSLGLCIWFASRFATSKLQWFIISTSVLSVSHNGSWGKTSWRQNNKDKAWNNWEIKKVYVSF